MQKQVQKGTKRYLWYDTDYKISFVSVTEYNSIISVISKKGSTKLVPAKPSFGVTTTKTLSPVFAWHGWHARFTSDTFHFLCCNHLIICQESPISRQNAIYRFNQEISRRCGIGTWHSWPLSCVTPSSLTAITNSKLTVTCNPYAFTLSEKMLYWCFQWLNRNAVAEPEKHTAISKYKAWQITYSIHIDRENVSLLSGIRFINECIWDRTTLLSCSWWPYMSDLIAGNSWKVIILAG